MSSHIKILIVLIGVIPLSEAATITVGEDGCDFYRIEAALSAAKIGDVIEVHSGDYWVNLNITTPSIVLRGIDTGGGRPVLHAGSSTAEIEETVGGTTFMTEKSGGTAVAIRADFVTVEGFVITGVTWPRPYGSGEHNDLIGDAGIRVYSDFNKIMNNTFVGNDLTAIGLWNSSNNQIMRNTIKDTPYGYGIKLYNSHYNVIRENFIAHNDWGIEVQRCDGTDIDENEIVENINDGISIYNSNSTFITGNIISMNGHESEFDANGMGIRLQGSRSLISRNIISHNRNAGIKIHSIFWDYCAYPPCDAEESYENLVIDNRIEGNGDDGIQLEKTWQNYIMGNNITSNHGKGIGLMLSNNNKIDENNITKNSYGIYLDRSNYTKVNNNTMRDMEKAGIYMWSCINSSAYNNTVIGGLDGIALEESSQDNSLIMNRISNATAGINITTGSSRNRLERNLVRSCQTGVRLSGSSRNFLTGNKIVENAIGLTADATSRGNVITKNDLSSNREAARDEGDNRWDDGLVGNYYGDCKDSDGDGLCDSTCRIPGGDNTDSRPLAAPILF